MTSALRLSRWTRTWYGTLGNVIKTENSAGNTSRSYYDALNRLEKSVGPSGAIQLYVYNNKGQVQQQVLDSDRDGIIDYDGMDRISETLSEFVNINGETFARSTSKVWNLDNLAIPALITSVSEQRLSAAASGISSLSRSTSFGLTSTSVTAY